MANPNKPATETKATEATETKATETKATETKATETGTFKLPASASALLSMKPAEPAVRTLEPIGSAGTAGGNGKVNFPLASVIELTVSENPKKPGSDTRARFDAIRTGMTVDQYLQASARIMRTAADKRTQWLRDVSWAVDHGQIAVWPAGTTVAEVTANRKRIAAAAAAAQIAALQAVANS